MSIGLSSNAIVDTKPAARAGRAGFRASAKPKLADARDNGVDLPDAAAAQLEWPPATDRRRALRVLAGNGMAVFGIAALAAVFLSALTAHWFFPGDPQDMVGRAFQWPGQDSRFLLGTDALGRDVAAGIAHGARVSLMVGIVAAGIGVTLGVAAGAIAGYFGKWIEDVLMRLVEVMETLPNFIILVVLVAIVKPSISTIAVTIGFISWAPMARLVRGEFRSLREKDFVVAARSMGFGDLRIVVREILPNALPPIIVLSSVMAASAILMESALSFMGLGDPNLISWGTMIGAGREALRTAWYLTAIPGIAIVVTVLALNLIGDGLNDALNPRHQRGR